MLGLPDLLIVGGIALLVFGPKRLPELAKALGSGIRDFKKALEGEEEKDKAKLAQSVEPATPTAKTVEPEVVETKAPSEPSGDNTGKS